jgi:hypothetical protein
MKSFFLHGLIGGILASLASITYMKIYQDLNFVDFSSVLNMGGIIGASLLGCMLMAVAYFLLNKLNLQKYNGMLNLLIILLSFVSILGPLMISLPLELDFPELFPALAVPMHFFPAMIFFGIQPFFSKTEKE